MIRDVVVEVRLPRCEHKFQWLDEMLPFNFASEYKYRGHADCGWPLKTSMERMNAQFRVPLPEAELRQTVLSAFQSSSDLFFDWKPQDDLEWFSQIQHYGGPTPLLDFTDSFWVGLYFAVWPHIQNSAKSDFSVVGIRSTCLPDGLIFHHPKRLNARIMAQQGLFLAKTDATKTADEILSSAGIDFASATVVDDLDGAKALLRPDLSAETAPRVTAIRFVFPSSSDHQVLQYLYQMNITGSSLFPDHEGAIQNLKNEFHLLRCMANNPSHHTAESRAGARLPASGER